jgi:hypothetical protein
VQWVFDRFRGVFPEVILNAVPDGGGECPAVADELRVQHDITTTRLLFSNNKAARVN